MSMNTLITLEMKFYSAVLCEGLGLGLETKDPRSRSWSRVFLKRSWQQHWNSIHTADATQLNSRRRRCVLDLRKRNLCGRTFYLAYTHLSCPTSLSLYHST